MSWLSRSIADTLRIDGNDEDSDKGEEDEKNGDKGLSLNLKHEEGEDEDEDDEDRAGRGVREDLSEFRETLTRQLWGVASFLAPPPSPPPLPPSRHRIDRSFAERNRWEPRDDQSCSGSVGDSEMEVSGGIRTGIQNQTSFTQFEDEEDPIGDAVGITEEVLAFAMNIAHHPETWLDFPLEEEEDIDDLDMSDAQRKHSLAIQRLTARLAALRIELCPAHMSEGYFWKVYFVLLHSRLNKQDADLLSTPQIVAARAIWMQELQKRIKEEADWSIKDSSDMKDRVNKWNDSFDHRLSNNSARSMSPRTSVFGPATYSPRTELEAEKHPIVDTEMQFVDKAVIEEEPVMRNERKDLVAGPSFKQYPQNYGDDDEDDDWLKEDSELEGYNTTAIVVGNDEDVSFSDLEDDEDDCTMPVKSKIVTADLGMPKRAP